ncbi:MAG: TAXI family TRAP transporter solute-binding subunit [Betaproteobacteria bacterium]|nr:TAXI family TRAP transporter solute-binding subunit [Betaproteobacteria bacterium]MBV9359909.1 TAXI family TRAP transporter solute-binding subunit [Betaproteobacteria bacterium]
MDLIFALVLGTATPGGGFPLYGDAFAAMVNAQEPKLRIEPRNTKGSTENVALLEANQVDLALVLGEIASAALAKPDTGLRIITAMYASPGVLMVKGDSPYRSLADLRGKPVVLGASASGITQLGRTVFSSLDIDIKPILLDKVADGPAMFTDGRAEAVWGAGVGWPAFVALAKSGGRFIGPSDADIQTILKKNASLQRVTLPAKSYPGQDGAIPSVGSWSYVLAKPALPEAAAYLLARAIHRAESPLAARLEQARETTMANTIAAAPRSELIHPGVRRYLAEAGLR